MDGFAIEVFDDEEFGGVYNFTTAYDHQSAHDAIFDNSAENAEDNFVNS